MVPCFTRGKKPSPALNQPQRNQRTKVRRCQEVQLHGEGETSSASEVHRRLFYLLCGDEYYPSMKNHWPSVAVCTNSRHAMRGTDTRKNSRARHAKKGVHRIREDHLCLAGRPVLAGCRTKHATQVRSNSLHVK